MTLHPLFSQYLEGLNVLIAENKAKGVVATPESARAALASLNQYATAPKPMQQVLDRSISYTGDEGPVQVGVRVYVPENYAKADSIMFVHGGGHMAGDLDVYDWQARRTAAATGMITVSVDYRRSPEHPFPAGLTDTYQVLQQMPELLREFAVTGVVHAVADSGGAAVVSSIAMRVAKGEWQSPISRQVLLYPSLDYTMSGETIERFASGYFLEADRIRWYFDHYLPAGVDWAAVSPVSGPFTSDMPETLVIAAEYDPLLSEAETYVSEMLAAGARAQLIVAAGMIHAYLFFESMVTDEVDATYLAMADFLKTGTARAASRLELRG